MTREELTPKIENATSEQVDAFIEKVLSDTGAALTRKANFAFVLIGAHSHGDDGGGLPAHHEQEVHVGGPLCGVMQGLLRAMEQDPDIANIVMQAANRFALLQITGALMDPDGDENGEDGDDDDLDDDDDDEDGDDDED